MVAVEIGEAKAGIERPGRRVPRLDLQAGARGAAVARPAGEAGDDPAGEPLAPLPRIGDHRLVAEEAVMDRAIGERRRPAIDCQQREAGGDRDGADDPAIDGALRRRVALQPRHRSQPFGFGRRREPHRRTGRRASRSSASIAP